MLPHINSYETITDSEINMEMQKKILAFSLHSRFVVPNLTLAKSDLDIAMSDKRCILFDSDFKVQLCLDFL
jgi:hypothetical protein